MFWIILGVVAIVVVTGICIMFTNLHTHTISIIVCIVFVCIALLGLINWGWHEEKLVKEVELVSLSNSTASTGGGDLFYVSISADNVYSYRYEIENTTGIEGTTYKVETVTGNVEELESKDCKVPMLKVYKQKPKGEFWFTFNETKTTYVFYVPEGSIVKEISLK